MLVVVLGSVAAALATYASAGLRQTVVIRDRADLRAGAEAGLRYGLEKLRLGQTVCNTAAAAGSATIPIPPTFNGRSVTLTCSATAGATADANAWAIIVTGVGLGGLKSLSSQAGAATTKKIGGPLYMAVPSSSDLKSPVAIEGGDLWYPDATCAAPTPPPVPNLTITDSPPRGTICTTATWDQIAPSPALPTFPGVIDPPGRNDLDGLANCRVFFPGVYTSPPALDGENYFVSGDYYFSNFGVFDVGHAVVIGGQPGGPSLGETPPVLTGHAPSCNTALANPIVAAAETGTGVTWVLGGNSSIDIGVQGELELFRRRQGSHTVSLITVEPSTATGGYVQSTLTATGTPAITTKSGNSNDLVVHGMVYAPRAAVEFGNVTASANGQIQGALVAARVELQASASATGLIVGLNAVPSNPTFALTATADAATGADVSVRAILQMDTSSRQIAINSWRVCPSSITPCSS